MFFYFSNNLYAFLIIYVIKLDKLIESRIGDLTSKKNKKGTNIKQEKHILTL